MDFFQLSNPERMIGMLENLETAGEVMDVFFGLVKDRDAKQEKINEFVEEYIRDAEGGIGTEAAIGNLLFGVSRFAPGDKFFNDDAADCMKTAIQDYRACRETPFVEDPQGRSPEPPLVKSIGERLGGLKDLAPLNPYDVVDPVSAVLFEAGLGRDIYQAARAVVAIRLETSKDIPCIFVFNNKYIPVYPETTEEEIVQKYWA